MYKRKLFFSTILLYIACEEYTYVYRFSALEGTNANMPAKKKPKVRVDEFNINFCWSFYQLMNNSRILEVSNVRFIQQNGSQMRYIYDIVEGILGCDVILSRMFDGQDSDDEDTRWKNVSTDEGILRRVYLIDCDYEGIKLKFPI